jgi:predicted nucleic acid-binding protein
MLFVDTSVWSLAFRRNAIPDVPEVSLLTTALKMGEPLTTTGFVLQELLQGFAGPTASAAIITRFQALPLLSPDRTDHINAANIRNQCRRAGIQVGTIDATIAQLCIRHDLELLTTDQDFRHMQKVVSTLRVREAKRLN